MGKGGVPCPKPRPSLLTKRDAKRQEQADERRVRAAVKKRELNICRVCAVLGFEEARERRRGGSGETVTRMRLGNQMHHIVPRSLGGKDTTANCIWICAQHHSERHAGVIRITGTGDGEIHVERIWR